MQNTDRAGESKKKKRKRTIDKAKVAENKKKAKAGKKRNGKKVKNPRNLRAVRLQEPKSRL